MSEAASDSGRRVIRLSFGTEQTAVHRYEVATRPVVSDLPLAALRPFAVRAGAPAEDEAAANEPRAAGSPGGLRAPDRAPPSPIYWGPGWVGGRLVTVESWHQETGYRLRFEDAADVTVSAAGERVELATGGRNPTPREVEAVLGPGLVLALALGGTWALHASAVERGGRCVALCGDSGSGKSTLAAACSDPAASGWRRMADDLLPVRAARGGVDALPAFPQLKLAAAEQWRRPALGCVEVAAVYLLEPRAPRVEITRPSARAAALALVGQTVAARLFAPALQAAHLDASIEIARRLPVRQLQVPWGRQHLPAVIAAVEADLG